MTTIIASRTAMVVFAILLGLTFVPIATADCDESLKTTVGTLTGPSIQDQPSCALMKVK